MDCFQISDLFSGKFYNQSFAFLIRFKKRKFFAMQKRTNFRDIVIVFAMAFDNAAYEAKFPINLNYDFDFFK